MGCFVGLVTLPFRVIALPFKIIGEIVKFFEIVSGRRRLHVLPWWMRRWRRKRPRSSAPAARPRKATSSASAPRMPGPATPRPSPPPRPPQARVGRPELDPLFVDACDLTVDAGQVSVGMIQRYFHIGYTAGARLVDQMEAQGFVGPADGGQPREFLLTRAEWRRIRPTFILPPGGNV